LVKLDPNKCGCTNPQLPLYVGFQGKIEKDSEDKGLRGIDNSSAYRLAFKMSRKGAESGSFHAQVWHKNCVKLH
jgi:hypothetical protein